MKIVALLLLVAGWIIVLGAIVLLPPVPRTGFLLAGLGVQTLALVLLFRSHLVFSTPASQNRAGWGPRREEQE